MFRRLSKHLEFHQKYSTVRHIFHSLLGVWISRWNTVSSVWYITSCLKVFIHWSGFPFFAHPCFSGNYARSLLSVYTHKYKVCASFWTSHDFPLYLLHFLKLLILLTIRGLAICACWSFFRVCCDGRYGTAISRCNTKVSYFRLCHPSY